MKTIVLMLAVSISYLSFASPDGPAKGYNYKKHYKKQRIHKWIDKKIHKNICDQYSN